MFTDRIIEDLKKSVPFVNRDKQNYQWVKRMEKAQDDLKRSQRFFVGEIGDLKNALNSVYGSKLFGELVRLPYPKCSFTYLSKPQDFYGHLRGEHTHGCIIANEISSNLIQIDLGFFDSKNEKTWILLPTSCLISVNCEIADNPNLPKCMKLPDGNHDGNILVIHDRHTPYNNEYRDWCRFGVEALYFILQLLSCQNITTERHNPPEKANKRRRRKGQQELLSYHTLVLKPVGKRQESIPKHLWENRIHLCRGHFKTYTPEKPLFGRITGRFWWQPSVRGRNHEGVVLKDYEIDTSTSKNA